MAVVITASELSWVRPFSGLTPRQFSKLVTALCRRGAHVARPGRPWTLCFEDRVLLVVAYWRTNLTMRQLALLFGVSESTVDRVVDDLGPRLASIQRQRFRKGTVLIVDGTLVPTRDHTVAERSKNYRYSTNHHVVIDADTRLVVVVGRPLAGDRNDCKAWEESGAKAAVGQTLMIADGGYPGTGLLIPHRRDRGQAQLLVERGTQQVSQAGPGPRRAHLRPHENLEDPTGLPAQRRGCHPRHAWRGPSAQPRPDRLIKAETAASQSTRGPAAENLWPGGL
ncbi:transposase family protein [Streptomyces sp. NPDC054854]